MVVHVTTKDMMRRSNNSQSFTTFYLISLVEDGSAAEARQIVVDVSKAIAFCIPNKFTWRALFDHHMMKSYFDKVNQDGIGPDGIVTKLDRICYALNYLGLEVEGFEESGNDISSL